jgi:hypothetical protein
LNRDKGRAGQTVEVFKRFLMGRAKARRLLSFGHESHSTLRQEFACLQLPMNAPA